MATLALVRAWQEHGFVVLPGWLPSAELTAARAQLGLMFPSAEGFHSGADARRERFLGDEFAGIDTFPFTAVEISLLAVHDRLVRLARDLLGVPDVRLYSAEAWAKYTGAAEYDQWLHRDYLNHTLLVPSREAAFAQVELFVYLTDVPEDLGPPHLVSWQRTADLPARPNWYPPADLPEQDSENGFVATSGRPDLYQAEVTAAGPAGTVVAFHPGTLHRGTALHRPDGVRYTLHLSYRPAAVEWAQRVAWSDRSHDPRWHAFLARATPEQLVLFGFPPPGHPFWTPQTLAGMAERYPDLDLTAWRT